MRQLTSDKKSVDETFKILLVFNGNGAADDVQQYRDAAARSSSSLKLPASPWQ